MGYCIKSKIVRTKKEHTCIGCGGTIDTGEHCNCSTQVYDGSIHNL